MRRQDRVIARVIDAVGEAEQRGADDQRGVAQMHAEQDQRQAADGEADQQHFSGADMVGEIADRRLGQAGDDAEHGQREAELDIADAELRLQERKQHRQHEQMEMADPMRDRNRRQRAQRTVRFRLLRCGENIDHVSSKPRLNVTARQGAAAENSGWRLFVHECRCMAAPARRRSGECVNKIGRQRRAGTAMIRHA